MVQRITDNGYLGPLGSPDQCCGTDRDIGIQADGGCMMLVEHNIQSQLVRVLIIIQVTVVKFMTLTGIEEFTRKSYTHRSVKLFRVLGQERIRHFREIISQHIVRSRFLLDRGETLLPSRQTPLGALGRGSARVEE